jgi:kynureninase
VPLESIGGFLALSSPQAAAISARLGKRGVLTDVRGNLLRLGPAPYLSDDQLGAAIDALAEAVRRGRGG